MTGEEIGDLYRDASPRVLATLIRVLGDFDLAEEVVQEAFAAALEQWPRDGAPANPAGWLVQTARNKAIDRLRRRTLWAGRAEALSELAIAAAPGPEVHDTVRDDLLRLVFTCCHPALALDAQVALALRTRWDRRQIAEGLALLDRVVAEGALGAYAVQAAIAAAHARPERAADTDWKQIAALYALLARLSPSPVVELNRAVAVAMADGPEHGLRILDAIEASGALVDYHLFHAARADLCRRAGRLAAAAESYRRALGLTSLEAERRVPPRPTRAGGGGGGGRGRRKRR